MKDFNTQFFLSGLALLFIGLKLGKVIDWPWYWVLSPIWMPIVIIVIVVAVIFLVGLVIKAVKKA